MLIVHSRDSVSVITLDRPQRRNALGTEMRDALRHALVAADRDPSVRSIVLLGTPPAFCAGSDLKELAGLSITEMCDHEADMAEAARVITEISKPVIAAVEGYALGGGFILAATCDVVVTARDARWHLPEVPNGWLPPWGLGALLARVGPVRARLLTWAAEAMDGNEAYRMGLADYVCEPGVAADRAMTLADALSKLPAEAVASTKRFFEPFAAANAELMDRLASRAFASNCEGESAKAVLSKFGARA